MLKANDTRPVLEVALKNPDGNPHDLTGSTTWKLLIRVNATQVLVRDLIKQGADTAGVLRYTWVNTDWANPIIPNDPVLPTPVDAYHTLECYMEYEISGGPTSRMTFPNGGYDTLRILGQLA